MPSFNCSYCGYGSLVRSNFKLTPGKKPLCRRPACEQARSSGKYYRYADDALPTRFKRKDTPQ